MENPLKRFDVVVVRVGYVGPVTGATLSHLGHRVSCVDRDGERISALESGRLPFYEPNLEELVSLGVRPGCAS
jgi:UDPglucose 6-dehydrogenase